MAKIGFIGLGNMGAGMAGCLIGADHDVAVYNRSRAKAEPLAAQGARIAASPREAAEGAEAVFAMVSDDAASRTVWLGADGVLAADLSPGAFAVECSTLSYDWVGELAAAAAEKGLRYIDCPVTGLPEVAAAGSLTLLVGAARHDLAASGPLLDVLSDEIIHFGPVRAGTAYKLMINLMGAVQIAGVAEGMAIAEKAGLDMQTVVEAIAKGQAASPQVVRNARRIADDAHDTDILFTGRLRLKDADYGVRLAEGLGVDAAFGRVAVEAFRRLAETYPDLNESKVIEVARGAAKARRP
ncbi:MAG: NAD(P)-dependent oxidoreductase [Methyloligellaceae bacterium]